MYLFGYSIDNLSLMALTIATGFVVDDAIVVIENITRHLEAGVKPLEAALVGAQEIGFTVVSISISLVAVFIPDPADGRHRRPAVPRVRGDAVGGHLRLDAGLADDDADDVRQAAQVRTTRSATGGCIAPTNAAFDWILGRYASALRWVLRHQPVVLTIFS